MENQRNINLALTIEECNTILDALVARPFKEVFQLISKIQEQAGQQLRETAGATPVEDKAK